ncbi:hypothetical protein ACFZBE_32750 [Streptomyces sp. NPDC008061]|uniref:hypothetical protein n=1 Tax=Streptomyces sp. NPDC008061 TaxID=3364805 RepID=UPI0036EAE9E1
MAPTIPENPLTSENAPALPATLPARVEVKRGMSEREPDQVEERWEFRFAPEHRMLLRAGLPTASRKGITGRMSEAYAIRLLDALDGAGSHVRSHDDHRLAGTQ